ncbi:PrgI family protein [Candidatus Curtissbacteria bacterium]|nr:PrgI family protein [Candidatus Curtissbacteria bacterium]
MDQHPVPQHIASFEFKLFGNLTVRQFITLAIPMSLALAIYFSNLAPIVRLPLAGSVALLAIFAALVPVGGRPLDKWAVVFIKAILAPTQRIWIKESKIPEFLKIVVTAPPKEEHQLGKTAIDRERLFAYLRSLPKGNLSPLDVKEQLALGRLNLVPGPKGGVGVKLPPPIIWATPLSLPQIETTFAVAGQQEGGKLPMTQEQIYPRRFEEALPPKSSKIEKAPVPKIASHAKPFVLPGVEKRLAGTAATIAPREEEMIGKGVAQPETAHEPIELVTFLEKGKQLATEIKPQRYLASEINYVQDLVIPVQTPDKHLRLLPGIGKTRVRKLHFAPPDGFDISKLPIRGERKFEISEELKRRYQLEESNPNVSPEVILPTEDVLSPKVAQRQPVIKPLGETVIGRRAIPKPNVVLQTAGDVSLKKQEKKESYSKISVQGQKLSGLARSGNLLRAQIVPLTNKPNVLSGLIMTRDGVPVEGAIFVVLDQNGIPVRALKTNKLGQFLSATSLPNGQYHVEVETDWVKFDPFSINLTGQVVGPLEIKAKE